MHGEEGRICLQTEQGDHNIRVSVVLTVEGEAAVHLRPLSPQWHDLTSLGALRKTLRPSVRLAGYIPDPKAEPPDATAAEKDMVDTPRATARQWRKPDRVIFELRHLGGLHADDVALTLRCDSRSVRIPISRFRGQRRSTCTGHRVSRLTSIPPDPSRPRRPRLVGVSKCLM